MALDPFAPPTLDPMARLYQSVAELERRASANPGAQAGYAADLSTVSTSSANYADLGGPSVTLRVPDGGAFVQLYAELEGADVNNTGSPARAAVYEPTDLPLVNSADGTFVEFNTHGAFELRRLSPGIAGASQTKLGLGGFATYWASPGLRTYSLRYAHILGNVASFRNRRLWARVSY